MGEKKVIIIGAGPAGLSAALTLLRTTDMKPVIIEQENAVGGIAKTYYENGYGTDIGPHRFFTKSQKVFDLWTSILEQQGKPAADDLLLGRETEQEGADPETDDNVFLKRKRFSRIYYRKHFIDYPIKINPAIFCALGLGETLSAGFSYMKSVFVKLPETNLESFMINRFGRKLYELFFEGYTQKVWGVHPSEISKEWGSQRIKGVSLVKVLINAICSTFKLNTKKETSLIDEYFYPKLGASQMWENMAKEITERGGEIILNHKVTGITKQNDRITEIKILNQTTNEERVIAGDEYISSMPVKEFASVINDMPQDIKKLAEQLQYRDFILVNFVTNNLNLKNNTDFKTVNNIAPDSWIYLQDNNIIAGRLDIMNNFSPYMIKNFKEDVVLNLEYFCNENDELWNKSDEELIETAIQELLKLDALTRDNILSSKVIRVKKAYPSYFGSYEHFDEIKNYIDSVENVYFIGRNGQHKYNNMDHSVLSGITAAEIIKNKSDKKQLWDINTEASYQES